MKTSDLLKELRERAEKIFSSCFSEEEYKGYSLSHIQLDEDSVKVWLDEDTYYEPGTLVFYLDIELFDMPLEDAILKLKEERRS